MIISILKKYLEQVIGVNPAIMTLPDNTTNVLPLYLKMAYKYHYADLFFGNEYVLVEPIADKLPTPRTIKAQAKIIEEKLKLEPVFITMNIPPFIRKRLMENKINFIDPDKQIYIQKKKISLTEKHTTPISENKPLMPAAQLLVLYHLLTEPIDNIRLQLVAEKLKCKVMAVTRAVKELENKAIITIEQKGKEKHIRFNGDRKKIWAGVEMYLYSPVIKRMYADEMPAGINLYKSYMTALPDYSDITEGRQLYYAVDKKEFPEIEKRIKGLNDIEGDYCIEIWKYDPGTLGGDGIVDPLSLYLTCRGDDDERVAMALEGIIKKYVWLEE